MVGEGPPSTSCGPDPAQTWMSTPAFAWDRLCVGVTRAECREPRLRAIGEVSPIGIKANSMLLSRRSPGATPPNSVVYARLLHGHNRKRSRKPDRFGQSAANAR